MLLFCFLSFSWTVTSRIRFGVCPPVPERTDCPSLVWDDCTCDTDCPGTKKCCLNGCNYACLERGKSVYFHQSSLNHLFLCHQAHDPSFVELRQGFFFCLCSLRSKRCRTKSFLRILAARKRESKKRTKQLTRPQSSLIGEFKHDVYCRRQTAEYL